MDRNDINLLEGQYGLQEVRQLSGKYDNMFQASIDKFMSMNPIDKKSIEFLTSMFLDTVLEICNEEGKDVDIILTVMKRKVDEYRRELR